MMYNCGKVIGDVVYAVMVTWFHGDMAPWYHDDVVPQRYGATVVWRHGDVEEINKKNM